MKNTAAAFLVSLILFAAGCGGGGGGSGAVASGGPAANQLTADGGTLAFGDVAITARENVLTDDTAFDVTRISDPPALPGGAALVGQGIDIEVPAADQLNVNGPIGIAVHYDDANIVDENNLLAFHFDEQAQRYEAVRINRLDVTNNIIEFETRTFSTFVLGVVDGAIASSAATGFDVPVNGWGIGNDGHEYFCPRGTAWGCPAMPSGFSRTEKTNSL